ncbi:MAG: lipoyl(octanoyl) transferase LipB [Saprospiraceae bacterium]|nr:lipoyl(octanoyl) transferase LipB [Saprospiraceae bacterium]
MEKPFVQVRDLGRIAYDEALHIQKGILDQLVQLKLANRNRKEAEIKLPVHQFLFCEHDPVFTLGRTGKEDHLLLNEFELQQESIAFYKTNRGGDITFHGPGQIVGYPIFDLEFFFTDVHKYVRYIEEGVIRTLADYEIQGDRIKGYTGVWLKARGDQPERKICAIGIHLSRWISMHGFAFNVNTNLQYFNKIVPCGITDEDKDVTSLSRELGYSISLSEVKNRLITHYAELFNFDFRIEDPFYDH